MSILGNARRVTRAHWEPEFGLDGLDLLGRGVRRILRTTGDECALWPGQVALAEGAAIDWVFIVLGGELALRRAGSDLRILRAGALFGALDAFGRHRASADLVARDVSRLLVLPVRAYTGLVATEPSFSDWVIRTVARQIGGEAGAEGSGG